MFVLLQVHTDTVATGIANVAGNKGACGVSMTLLDNTTIAFVGSHLAARASRVHERNNDVREIYRSMHLRGDRTLSLPQQFDHLFWLGDLNYRIDRYVCTPRCPWQYWACLGVVAL